jgi:flagellar hook-associated protein 2
VFRGVQGMFGSSITGINFTGLASGIDTEAIIQKMIELQTRPLQRLMVRKSELSARMSAYDQFRGLVSNLQTAAGALSVKNAFNLIRANSSDTQVATVSASTDAVPGTYELRVSKLAQAHKIISGAHPSAYRRAGRLWAVYGQRQGYRGGRQRHADLYRQQN